MGWIALENHERESAFGDAEVRLLSTVTASMGVALENARLLEATQRNARESSALSDVGRDLSSTLDLATVMDRIAAHARDLLAAENSAIFLPDAETGNYRAIVALGEIAEAIMATRVEPGRGIIGSLLESGKPERVNSTADDPRTVHIAGTDTRADERLMVVPLLAAGTVQGAMAVWRSGGKPFEAHELDFLEGLSRQAAIALQTARLFDGTRKITGITEVLGLKDHEYQYQDILIFQQEGLLFVGTDDGLIQVSEDGGAHWRRQESFPGVGDYAYVSRVVASRFDKRTVFQKNLPNLTGLEVGHGGVWALCAPNLLFFPTKSGSDDPLVSQRQTTAAPASAAARTQSSA
jgi:hypothetical protein